MARGANGEKKDLEDQVGAGADPEPSPAPGSDPGGSGSKGGVAPLTAQEQAQAAAGITDTKAPSSYDAKNNFNVPIRGSYTGYYGSQMGTVPEVTMPFDQAYNSGFLGAPEELRKLVVNAAGGDPLKYDTIYKAAIYQASMERQGGNADITVESLLQKWNKSGVPAGLNGGGGGGGGPFRTVNRQVALTDAGTARLVVNQALTRFLGREATDIEQRAFLKALNVQEKQNPTTTVTEGTTSGRNTTSKSTTTGGFSRDNFAEKFAQSQEGYAEYQTATTYLDAFIDALENPMRAI